jgi:uncharacterized cupin superfamily protein
MPDIDKNELIQSLMRLRKRCCGGVSAASMTTNARMARDNSEFQKIIQGVKTLTAERDEAMALVKTIAHDVSVLSTRPAAIVKLHDLVDRINEWGDAARNIISQSEDGKR